MKISIIIPVYNEEKTIKKILQKIKKAKLPSGTKEEIIVVDDGSTDRSLEFIRQFTPSIKLIRHQKNKGKGEAVKNALVHATGKVVIIQDADLEYDPHDYLKLLKPFEDKSVKVVYGSRALGNNRPSHWTFYLGGKFLTLLTNLLYGTGITDEPTGYKVFRKEILKNLKLRSKGFEFCSEVTAKIAKAGIKIIEVPISYNPRSVSEKKIKWYDGLAAIYYLSKYRFID